MGSICWRRKKIPWKGFGLLLMKSCYVKPSTLSGFGEPEQASWAETHLPFFKGKLFMRFNLSAFMKRRQSFYLSFRDQFRAVRSVWLRRKLPPEIVDENSSWKSAARTISQQSLQVCKRPNVFGASSWNLSNNRRFWEKTLINALESTLTTDPSSHCRGWHRKL